MKKVFLCIPTLSSAGAEKFTTDLALKLDKTKFDVSVIITYKLEKTPFVSLLNESNIRIIDVSSNNKITTIKKLYSLFKSEKPDIVHANVGSLYYVVIPACLRRVKKIVFTVHSMANRIFSSGMQYRFCCFCFKRLRVIPVGIAVTVTNSICSVFQLTKENVPTINNGVDIEKYSVPINKVKSDTVTFINVGTLYYIKNQKYLIEVFSELIKRHDNARLKIVGDGELREEIEDLIAKLEVQDYVQLLGSSDKVESLLQKADVYVSSSLVEGLPLSVLEGMACGLPVIANNVGGIPDIVKDKENGMLVELGDRSMMLEKMSTLITDESERSKMSMNARLTAEEWSIDNCVRGYELLYEQ